MTAIDVCAPAIDVCAPPHTCARNGPIKVLTFVLPVSCTAVSLLLLTSLPTATQKRDCPVQSFGRLCVD